MLWLLLLRRRRLHGLAYGGGVVGAGEGHDGVDVVGNAILVVVLGWGRHIWLELGLLGLLWLLGLLLLVLKLVLMWMLMCELLLLLMVLLLLLLLLLRDVDIDVGALAGGRGNVKTALGA